MKKINNMQNRGGQPSCFNNQGFAISGIMYAILIISLLLVVGTLKTLQNRKTIIDKLKIETVNAVDSNNYQQLLSKVEQLENGIVNKIYPIGSVYISMDNTKNPSELFGGIWEQIGQGRTLIGAGTNDGYTFTVGSTGTTVGATTNPLGEYVHTLTISEMPEHKHIDIDLAGDYYAFISSNNSVFTSYGSTGRGWQIVRNNEIVPATKNLGGGNSHNNIQPYIVTYMWRRTS